jgi:hypothetical protein
LPGLAHPKCPWFTWLTGPKVPSFAAAGPSDALLIADPTWRKRTAQAGWPDARVIDAAWPVQTAPLPPAGVLAMIADVADLNVPENVENYSSHRLLWNLIADEILANPFVVASDPVGFLSRRVQQSGIAIERLDQVAFLEQLIVPAWQIGIARILRSAGLPVRVYGRGWEHQKDLEPIVGGAVEDRAIFDSIVSGAQALVHPLPVQSTAHPIESLGRPILRPASDRSTLLADATTALRSARCEPSCPPLSVDAILRLKSQI